MWRVHFVCVGLEFKQLHIYITIVFLLGHTGTCNSTIVSIKHVVFSSCNTILLVEVDQVGGER